MPKKPTIDYKMYFNFKDGSAFCIVPDCKRPNWAYSLTGGNTKSMLKHLRDKHPDEYKQGVSAQAALLAAAAVLASGPVSDEHSLGGLSLEELLAEEPPAEVPPVEKETAKEHELDPEGEMELSDGSSLSISPPYPISPPKKMPRRRVVIEDSSDDEAPGPFKASPVVSKGIPGVERPICFGSVDSGLLKLKLEKLLGSAAPPPPTRTQPDRPGRKLGIALAKIGGRFDQFEDGGPSPVVDVGDSSVIQVNPPEPLTDDKDEADTSSDEQEPSTSAAVRAPQKRYVVEKILKKRVVDGEVQLYTKWNGYKRPQWQPYSNFDKTNEAVMAFELQNANTAAESTDDDADLDVVN